MSGWQRELKSWAWLVIIVVIMTIIADAILRARGF